MPKHPTPENNRRWFWLAWAGIFLFFLILLCVLGAELIALVVTTRG